MLYTENFVYKHNLKNKLSLIKEDMLEKNHIKIKQKIMVVNLAFPKA